MEPLGKIYDKIMRFEKLTPDDLDIARQAKADMFAILDSAPAEVPGLLNALRGGRIDGTAYEGDCACLVGTIANLQGAHYKRVPGIQADHERPAERWFYWIDEGETPDNSRFVKLTEEWILKWLDKRAAREPDDADRRL